MARKGWECHCYVLLVLRQLNLRILLIHLKIHVNLFINTQMVWRHSGGEELCSTQTSGTSLYFTQHGILLILTHRILFHKQWKLTCYSHRSWQFSYYDGLHYHLILPHDRTQGEKWTTKISISVLKL